MTAAEVAAELRCSTEHVAKLVKSKKLAGVNLGGQLGIRVDSDELKAFLRGRKPAPAPRGRRPAK